MGCFIVPATEAVVTTVATKLIESRENEKEIKVNPFSHKMKWLNKMLWGGSGLLAFEHVWHGEVIASFPFLTAAKNSEDFVEMLHEMSTTGVTMAVAVTLIWAGMCVATSVKPEKKGTLKKVEVKADHFDDNVE